MPGYVQDGTMVEARAAEQRLEGCLAVQAEAEGMRVMKETLGHPTAVGNLKLKVKVQVSNLACCC